jgi:hypothetical protein
MTRIKYLFPLSKRFFPGLLPVVGNETYQKVIARYENLCQNCDFPENPQLRRHLTDGILPGLAYYQILRESGESQKTALENIDRTFDRIFAGKVKMMQQLGKFPFVYIFLRLFIKYIMRQYPREGWIISWKQNDGNAIRFDMKSCFYFDTLSKFGAPELTPSFCRVDDLVYKNMSPYLLWQRSKTIAGGNTYCDFCFACKKNSPVRN